MAQLAAKYCEIYKATPKVFIDCFVKYPSIRTVCESITVLFPVESEKDFTDYCNKLQLSDTDKLVLNKTLKMIYETTKE